MICPMEAKSRVGKKPGGTHIILLCDEFTQPKACHSDHNKFYRAEDHNFEPKKQFLGGLGSRGQNLLTV